MVSSSKLKLLSDRGSLTDCYQRLEFLGDAVIDYLVTRYLYEGPHKFNPVVRHGLHRCLLHCNPGLFNAVARFVQHQERSSEEESGSSDEDTMAEILDLNAQRDEVRDNPTYWKVLQRFYYHEEECLEPEEVEVPKALGDLFESLMGAVFLDCGMSLDTVWRIIYRLFGREIESFSERVPLPPHTHAARALPRCPLQHGRGAQERKGQGGTDPWRIRPSRALPRARSLPRQHSPKSACD
ncbi:hypothetical protein MTO96_005488 [Rhipicephalus appendiculatus]